MTNEEFCALVTANQDTILAATRAAQEREVDRGRDQAPEPCDEARVVAADIPPAASPEHVTSDVPLAPGPDTLQGNGA